MAHRLKIPHALTRLGLEGDQAIGIQIIANPVGAVEIECRRARGDEHQSPLFIHTHPRPAVGGAAVFPGVLRPGLIARLARVRQGVKRPPNFAAAGVVSTDVTRRRWQVLAHKAAQNQQVLVNDAGARRRNGLEPRITAQPLA